MMMVVLLRILVVLCNMIINTNAIHIYCIQIIRLSPDEEK